MKGDTALEFETDRSILVLSFPFSTIGHRCVVSFFHHWFIHPIVCWLLPDRAFLINPIMTLWIPSQDSGSSGFDDYGGDLELYDLNMSDASGPQPKLVGKVKTATRFSSLGWTSPVGSYDMGLIGGGMGDGVVNIWNPAEMMKTMTDGADNDKANSSTTAGLVTTIKRHEGGAVKALQFNKLAPEKLATGGSDGQLLITSLENPTTPVTSLPGTEPSKGAECAVVSWNTQVPHIVASGANDGMVSVWDLNGKKPWCQFRADSASMSAMAWNPSQGLHLVTASVDDRNPVLKLWDLRASTSMPLATLTGHSQGVLDMSWCPHDDTLLLSCGKDNRTILWDLFTLQPIADIPNTEVVEDPAANAQQTPTASSLYGAGGLSSSQQKRYEVEWSPVKRGVVSTCSFDRKVQTHSVIGLATVRSLYSGSIDSVGIVVFQVAVAVVALIGLCLRQPRRVVSHATLDTSAHTRVH